MDQLERVQVIYSGYVQGIGFRFTARRIASQMGLFGFVKNLPDGGVLLVLEGEHSRLGTYLSTLNAAMSDYIKDKDISWQDPTGEFNTFEIKF